MQPSVIQQCLCVRKWGLSLCLWKAGVFWGSSNQSRLSGLVCFRIWCFDQVTKWFHLKQHVWLKKKFETNPIAVSTPSAQIVITKYHFPLKWKWKSLSCVRLCSLLDYTVHGILQARVLKWVAFPFSRESSQPRNQTRVSCIAGRFFTNWAMREAYVPLKGTRTPWTNGRKCLGFTRNIYGSESKWSIANLKGFHWPKKERDKFTNQKNKCKVLNIQMC